MSIFALDMLRKLFALSRRAEFEASRTPCTGGRVPERNLIFRMRSWPQLPEHGRTAEVYRMLSVMSNQPVRRDWLLARCSMAPQQLDELLQQLVADGSVEVIDPAGFADSEALRG